MENVRSAQEKDDCVDFVFSGHSSTKFLPLLVVAGLIEDSLSIFDREGFCKDDRATLNFDIIPPPPHKLRY